MATPFAGPPLQFDYAGVESLAGSFDDTADLLEAQQAVRPGHADRACQPWDGQLRQEFDHRVDLTISDAGRLADGLRTAATGLRELAESARAEDERREWARAWEREQQDRAWYEKVADNVGDFFGGDDPIPRPPGPSTPPSHEVLVTVHPRP